MRIGWLSPDSAIVASVVIAKGFAVKVIAAQNKNPI